MNSIIGFIFSSYMRGKTKKLEVDPIAPKAEAIPKPNPLALIG